MEARWSRLNWKPDRANNVRSEIRWKSNLGQAV
jgi:hypothetical protein